MEVKVPILMGSKKATVGKIRVSPGNPVTAGEILFSLETKKGTMTVKASADGIVESVLVSEGDQVATGQALAVLRIGTADPMSSDLAASDSLPARKPQTLAPKPTQEKSSELLILGGGPGGYVAAIAAAKHGKQVTLVEKNPSCRVLACRNVPWGKAFTGDAGRFKARGPIDLVLVDPPRTGLDKEVPSLIASWKPARVLYMSCNSVTLARDVARFLQVGYAPKRLAVFDMYPQTWEQEACIVLDRKE